MRVWVLLVFCSYVIMKNEAAMSDAQLKAALKLLRNVCQPKNKATNEQIEAMHKGDWNQDRNGMLPKMDFILECESTYKVDEWRSKAADFTSVFQCYMQCVLSMYKLMKKDNTLDYDVGMSTIETQAPQSIKETAIHALNSCKDAAKTTSDKCVAGFEIAHCIYLDNPAAYFLP